MPKIKTKHQKLLYALLLYQREWLGKKDSQNNGQEMALKWLKIVFSVFNFQSCLARSIMLLGWTINQQRCRLNIKAQFLYNSRHLRSLLGLLPKKGQKLRCYINIRGQRARAAQALISPINQERCRCIIISTVYRCWGVKRGTVDPRNNGPKSIGKYDENRICPIPWHFFSPFRLATTDFRNKWQLGLIPANPLL